MQVEWVSDLGNQSIGCRAKLPVLCHLLPGWPWISSSSSVSSCQKQRWWPWQWGQWCFPPRAALRLENIKICTAVRPASVTEHMLSKCELQLLLLLLTFNKEILNSKGVTSIPPFYRAKENRSISMEGDDTISLYCISLGTILKENISIQNSGAY